MNEGAPATEEEWNVVIHHLCETVLHSSRGEAVFMAVFDAPWMDLDEKGHAASMGMAGTGRADPRQLASELRTMADTLERNAERVADGESFKEVIPRV